MIQIAGVTRLVVKCLGNSRLLMSSVCVFEREAAEGKRSGTKLPVQGAASCRSKREHGQAEIEWDTLSPNYRGNELIFKIAKLSFTR